MSDTCLNFENGFEKLNKTPEFVKLIEDTKKGIQLDCPIITGGKRKSRKMKGGALTANQIRYGVQAFILFIMSYMTMNSSVAMEGIITGISAIYNGNCGGTSRLWGMIGLNNPVCTAYNTLELNITKALTGDATAISTLTGIITLTLALPYKAHALIQIGVYKVACTLDSRLLPPSELNLLRIQALGGVKEIEDGSLTQPHQSTWEKIKTSSNLNNSIPAAAIENSAGTGGGKRRTKITKRTKRTKRKTKKTRRTKKSKKGRKSRKQRKSRKGRK